MNDEQRAKSCLVTADSEDHNCYGQELIRLAIENDIRAMTISNFIEEGI
jgi:hypothetical protein